MEPDYHVPANRSPYRWRMIIRIVIAVLGGCFPMLSFIGEQLCFYRRNMANGDTVERYISLRPWLWSMLPFCGALGWLLIGIGRDSWLLVKRRGTPTVIPIPYWLALLFVIMTVVVYVLNSRISLATRVPIDQPRNGGVQMSYRVPDNQSPLSSARWIMSDRYMVDRDHRGGGWPLLRFH